MQKILIVEDEKAISGVLQSILSDELPDYEFVIAEDGLEGLKQIEKEDFTFVYNCYLYFALKFLSANSQF